SKAVRDMVSALVNAGVEPGPGQDRRDVRRLVDVGGIRQPGFGQRGEGLRVPLLDHAEAAELAFESVEVAVVIGVAGDEPVAADPVEVFDAVDDVDGEW